MRIAVIGAGFGGLSAAIRLQAMGHAVTIYEQRDQPGGRASIFSRDGYTFDAGPTILTAPHLIDELFGAAGRDRRDYVTFTRLDPAYNVRFPDGSVFHYHTDVERLRAEVARFNPHDVDGYDAFSREATAIFHAGMALIDAPFATMGSMLAVLPRLVRLRADRTVAELVNRHIRDERLRQVFSFHPLLVGGNPFTTTSVYALIHKLELEWGVWFAAGGTGALVRALVRVFEEIGGAIEYSTTVTALDVAPRSRRVTGVVVGSVSAGGTGVGIGGGTGGARRVACDAVVSNADAMTTHLALLPPHARGSWTPARVARRHHSMSLFVLYFGTTRTYPDLAHHEIIMGPRYRELLHDIFQRKVLPTDFSLYLHRPTATDRSLAPAGQDAWYALVPVPHLGGTTDWETAAPRLRDALVTSLEATLLPELSRHIESESSIDPRYFRDELGSHLGSAFALEPRLTQSAWFRPHNRCEGVDNLYLAGAGTHPGAGIPGVISSGTIVANLIGPAHD